MNDGWLWWPNDIRGPWGPKASWHLSYRWGNTPKKNLTQESCPDRGLNPDPLRDRRACYRLSTLFTLLYKWLYNIVKESQRIFNVILSRMLVLNPKHLKTLTVNLVTVYLLRQKQTNRFPAINTIFNRNVETFICKLTSSAWFSLILIIIIIIINNNNNNNRLIITMIVIIQYKCRLHKRTIYTINIFKITRISWAARQVIKWRACDVGEAKERLTNELWGRWSNGRVGEWVVT